MARQGQVRKPGVCYAATDEGIELPVVDITHPAFAPETDAEGLRRIAEHSVGAVEHVARMPAFVRALFARNSVLMGGSDGKRPFMTGMTTYLHKLGPDNLDMRRMGRFDRRAAGMISSVAVRFRLASVARLLADSLSPALAVPDGRPVRLLNIAGGPSSDSLNALILVRSEHPEWLEGRRVSIDVLELEDAGPRFAARCLDALSAECGPLHGVDVELCHERYDWSDANALRALLERSDINAAVSAGSSEGGLFEYGTDDEIAANMEALRDATPDDFAMVGTLWRDERITRAMRRTSPLSFFLRDIGPFSDLVGRAGWRVDTTIDDNPVYHIVRLKKA